MNIFETVVSFSVSMCAIAIVFLTINILKLIKRIERLEFKELLRTIYPEEKLQQFADDFKSAGLLRPADEVIEELKRTIIDCYDETTLKAVSGYGIKVPGETK